MGLLAPGIDNLEVYWDLRIEEARTRTGRRSVGSRFWFYPVLSNVLVRGDVASIKGLTMGVFTEVLSAEIEGKAIEDLTSFRNISGDRFAGGVSSRFPALARVHPSFSRLLNSRSQKSRSGRSGISSIGFVKLTDYRLFSAFLHESKPLILHIAAIGELPRFRSESS